MQKRLLVLTKDYSLFLFGARGTGKSTLIENTFKIHVTESTYLGCGSATM